MPQNKNTAPDVRYEDYDGDPRIVMQWPEFQGDYTTIKPEDIPRLVADLISVAAVAGVGRSERDDEVALNISNAAIRMAGRIVTDPDLRRRRGLPPVDVHELTEVPQLIRPAADASVPDSIRLEGIVGAMRAFEAAQDDQR